MICTGYDNYLKNGISGLGLLVTLNLSHRGSPPSSCHPLTVGPCPRDLCLLTLAVLPFTCRKEDWGAVLQKLQRTLEC